MDYETGCVENESELFSVQNDETSEKIGKSDEDHSRNKIDDERIYSNLLYKLEDTPAWHTSVVLGFQHYLLAATPMAGIPLIIGPAMCMFDTEAGHVARATFMCTLLFTSGLITFVQCTLGVRLPIMQGSSIILYPVALAILALPENRCPTDPIGNGTDGLILYNDTDGITVDGNELWQRRMRQIQGSVAVASLTEFFIGIIGATSYLIKIIGPLTVAPAIALIGLDLFKVAYDAAETHWGVAIFTIFLLTLCSQYLKEVPIPVPAFNLRQKLHIHWCYLFKLFPVIIALWCAWLLCFVLTTTNAITDDPKALGYRARTDSRSKVIANSPWFFFPYPGMWGVPSVSGAGVLGMIAGVIAGLVESISDYYACARIAEAPPPPMHAINRGVAVEGLGCAFSGLLCGTGTTSFSMNIAALGITRVASRRVLQISGVLFMLLGIFGKFGAVFVAIPDPVLGGLFCVTFGMIAAVGLSMLRHVDMNSPRNQYILGFSLFMGLVVPEWIKANPGAINTGIARLDQTISVILETSMVVGGTLACFLDNTVPGQPQERGIISWRHGDISGGFSKDDLDSYHLPFKTDFRFAKYLPFLPEYREETIVYQRKRWRTCCQGGCDNNEECKASGE